VSHVLAAIGEERYLAGAGHPVSWSRSKRVGAWVSMSAALHQRETHLLDGDVFRVIAAEGRIARNPRTGSPFSSHSSLAAPHNPPSILPATGRQGIRQTVTLRPDSRRQASPVLCPAPARCVVPPGRVVAHRDLRLVLVDRQHLVEEFSS